MSDVELNPAHGLFRNAASAPGNIALSVDERDYTYGYLATAAFRVATWLRSVVKQDDRAPRIGVLGLRSFELYAGILGAQWVGGTYIPLNPKMPAERLKYIFQKTGMDALIVDPRGAARLPELGEHIPPHVLSDWGSLKQPVELRAPVAVDQDHPAYIIFTSGTTGVPKGVMVSAANLAHFISCIRGLFNFRPQDRVSQFFETTFDVSVYDMFATWDAGASLHVVPETKLMAPGGFIRQHALTIWQSVPSVIAMMMKMKQLEFGMLPSLRIAGFGGEGLALSAAKAIQQAAPNAVVDNQYGPTEATIFCTHQFLTDPPVLTPGRGTLAIGTPLPGTHAAIVDSELNFLPDGLTGELAVCGPQLALGYLDDDNQTARRFPILQHPRHGIQRWYLTGDLAYCDTHGRFHCLGRVDNQVKVMGHRVELEEIEAHLRAVCGTDSVAAVAWPVVNGNPEGVIAFTCGGRLAPSAVRDELRQRIPNYMIPGRVVPLETMPLSTNGKIDRQVLRSLLDARKN